jgi:hypothetical protein
MHKTIVINGKFLSQHITGSQRFAYEIIHELDNIVSLDDHWILAVPYDSASIKGLEDKGEEDTDF